MYGRGQLQRCLAVPSHCRIAITHVALSCVRYVELDCAWCALVYLVCFSLSQLACVCVCAFSCDDTGCAYDVPVDLCVCVVCVCIHVCVVVLEHV